MFKKALSIVASLLLLTSCAPTATSTDGGKGEKIELVFNTFWGSETRKPIVEELVNEFNNSQDKITVKHVFVPWGEIFTKNKAAIAAGNPVDVIVNDVNSVPNRAAAGEVEDLSQFLSKDTSFKEEDYNSNYLNAMKYEGKIYGLPFAVDNRIIYYNKDHFIKAGLDPENPPKTWEELKQAAAKLDVKNGDKYEVMGFYPLFGNGGYDTWMINSDKGIDFYDENTQGISINTPSKVKALAFIDGFTKHFGKSAIDEFKASFGAGMQDPFISGKLSMMTQTPAYNNIIKANKSDMNFGVMPLPEMETGNGNWSNGGGFNLEIPKGAKNPAASYEFIKFLMSDKAQKIWSSKNFELSVKKSLGEDPELIKDPVYKLSSGLLSQTTPGVYPMNWLGYNDYLNPVLDELTAGSITPEEAAAKAQSQVETFLKSRN